MPLDQAEETEEAKVLREHPASLRGPRAASARARTAVKPGPRPGWASGRRSRRGTWPGPPELTRPAVPPGPWAAPATRPSAPRIRPAGRHLAPPRGSHFPGRPPGTKRGPGRESPPPPPRPPPRPDADQGQTAAGSANTRTPGAGVRRQVRPGSPQPRPVQPPLPLAVEGGRRPGRGAGWLTLGLSGGTRGSFHVVVRLLWSTKKGQPVCGSILISQPGGRGSPAPLPDAICTMGEWVAALMLGRGLPGGAAAGVPGRGEPSRGVPGLQAPSRSLAAAGSRAVRAADVSGKPAPGTFMN